MRVLPLLFLLSLLFSAASLAQNVSILSSARALPPLPEDRLQPLESLADLDSLVAAASSKRLVMLGESTHGTSEFYAWRDLLSRRLISEQGFNLILVEGDFASLYEVNRYIRHERGAARSARQLLSSLDRWPQWMWGNEEVVVFVEWLRAYNADKAVNDQVSFWGLDLYGEWLSYEYLLAALKKVDRRLYREAHKQYRCIARYKNNSWDYARAVKSGQPDCRAAMESVVVLLEGDHPRLEKLSAAERFYLQQNARVLQHAEAYYRIALIEGEQPSWNLRVEHMQKTLQKALEMQGEKAGVIVWAHNSHVGDARYTSMQVSGHVNIGQLAREHWGREAVFLVGFSTYEGRAIAALRWGDFLAAMRVPPASPGSAEDWLARAEAPDFYWIFDEDDRANEFLQGPWGHRAVGVVYSPAHDRQQYEPSVLPERYDALVFFRKSRALTPLVVPRR